MEIMNKNLQMLKDTNEKYCCCLGCGKKIKSDDGAFECDKCEKERELRNELEQLQIKRNKLNREIATLKKANLKQ